jgi:hypothetical protein
MPGSSVIERKKLYVHIPTASANDKLAIAWSSVSVFGVGVNESEAENERDIRLTSRVIQQNVTQMIELKMMPAKYGDWLTLSVYDGLFKSTRVTI